MPSTWPISPSATARASAASRRIPRPATSCGACAELRDVLDAHDAVHAQIGRFYRLTELMDPGSRDLLARVKRALDPDARMNPGALGL